MAELPLTKKIRNWVGHRADLHPSEKNSMSCLRLESNHESIMSILYPGRYIDCAVTCYGQWCMHLWAAIQYQVDPFLVEDTPVQFASFCSTL
jgi:hypothetical protein